LDLERRDKRRECAKVYPLNRNRFDGSTGSHAAAGSSDCPLIKDIDFSRNEVVVRSGKGNKDRYTVLPNAVRAPWMQHPRRVKAQHDADLKNGLACVSLRNALGRKYPMRQRVGLAMSIPCDQPLHRQNYRQKAPASFARIGFAASLEIPDNILEIEDISASCVNFIGR
jgi:hypothetical protein